MGNRNVKKENDSYLSANRRKRNRYLIKLGIPITVAAIILGIVFIIQAQEDGIGARMVLHIHPHLNITNDGKTATIPKNIGINSSLYNDHSLDKYGMQEMAPLHTHDNSGVIHVESSVKRN
jgi:hypothetical protein